MAKELEHTSLFGPDEGESEDWDDGAASEQGNVPENY
jgi:hypothetical protein